MRSYALVALALLCSTVSLAQDGELDMARKLILQQLQRRDFKGAVTSTDALLAEGAKDAAIFVLRGEAFYGLQQWKKASDAFAAGIKVDPPFAGRIPNHPHALLKQERIDEAGKAYEALLAAAKSDELRAQGHFGLGLVLIHKGESAMAITALEKAHALDPTSRKTNMRLGILYRGAKRPDDAIRHFEAVLADYGLHAAAAHNLALAWHEKGDEAKAREWKEKHEAIQKAHKEIGELRRQMTERRPDAALLARLADIYHAHHCYEEALRPYATYLRMKRRDVDVRYRMARCFAALERWGDAIAHLRNCVQLQPTHEKATKLLRKLESEHEEK